jgi:Na+/proline symporter
MLVGGGVVAVLWMVTHLDLSLAEGVARLREHRNLEGEVVNKARIFNFSLDPREAYTLFAGLVASTFLTLSTHGTDQDMVQRVLTCNSVSGGRKSLVLSAILSLPVAALFLCVGSCLWLFYGEDGAFQVASEMAARANESNPKKGFDYVFLRFVVTELPAGVRGLIVAGVFAAAMSSLDSAIAALSSTAVKSIWQPHVRPGRDEAYYLRASRIFAAIFGVVLVLVASVTWIVGASGSAKEGFGVLMLGLLVLTWIFPPLLGIFLVGVLTRRGSDRSNVIAVLAGVGLSLFFWFWSDITGQTERPVAYIWNSFLGCAMSFSIAVCFRGRGDSGVLD